MSIDTDCSLVKRQYLATAWQHHTLWRVQLAGNCQLRRLHFPRCRRRVRCETAMPCGSLRRRRPRLCEQSRTAHESVQLVQERDSAVDSCQVCRMKQGRNSLLPQHHCRNKNKIQKKKPNKLDVTTLFSHFPEPYKQAARSYNDLSRFEKNVDRQITVKATYMTHISPAFTVQ